MAVHPTVLWAQRSNESEISKNLIFLTIEILDPVSLELDLTATQLHLTAQSSDGSKDYELKLEFYEDIVPEKSHKTVTGSHISYILQKKEAKAEYWPRLLKEKLKLHYIKTDFDKWVDEDEQEANGDDEDMAGMMGGPGMGGPGMGGMSEMLGGMGGMGGMGGPDGGFDMSQLLGNAGKGDFDIANLASQLGQSLPESQDADGNDSESDSNE